MSDVIGFDNTKEKEHRLSNSLDGKLDLNVFVDKAVGKTCVFVNGIETEVLDAQDGKSPFYCGVVSIPRGEFTLSVESECEISRILLSETLTEISTRDEFEIQYTNRAGQGFFMRDVPEFTPEMIETLGEWVQCLHLHDIDGVKDNHQVPFTQKVDFARIVDALKKINYQGDVTLEVAYAPLKTPKELQKPLAKYLAEIANYFKGEL